MSYHFRHRHFVPFVSPLCISRYSEASCHEILVLPRHATTGREERLEVVVLCSLPPLVTVILLGQHFGCQ